MPNLKALRVMWNDRMDVYVQKKTVTNYITNLEDDKIHESIPCKLSFTTYRDSTTAGDMEPIRRQRVTVFCDRSYEIPAGAKLEITRAGYAKSFVYAASSEPRVFTHHQEIDLEVWTRWA